MAQHNIGNNVTVSEDSNGNAVIRNTNGDQYVRVTEDGVEIESLQADGLNNTLYAEPGELQATINNAPSGGGDTTVKLRPNTVYDEGQTITLSPDMTLDFNGATLRVSGDYDGVYIDNGCILQNGHITVTADTYSSDAIIVDQTTSTRGKFSGADDRFFINADVTRQDRAGDGTGIHLYTDSVETSTAQAGISFSTIEGYIDGFENGLYCETVGSGWINSLNFFTDLSHNHNNFYHTGSGECKSTLWGDIQMGFFQDEVGIHSPGGSSITHYGIIWDAQNTDGQWAIKGSDIHVVGEHLDNYEGVVDGDNVYGLMPGWPGLRWYHWHASNETARYVEFEMFSGGDWRINTDQGACLLFSDSGQIQTQGDYHFTENREDLTSRTPDHWAEKAYHDGTGSTSASLCFAVTESTWYNIRDDTTF